MLAPCRRSRRAVEDTGARRASSARAGRRARHSCSRPGRRARGRTGRDATAPTARGPATARVARDAAVCPCPTRLTGRTRTATLCAAARQRPGGAIVRAGSVVAHAARRRARVAGPPVAPPRRGWRASSRSTARQLARADRAHVDRAVQPAPVEPRAMEALRALRAAGRASRRARRACGARRPARARLERAGRRRGG